MDRYGVDSWAVYWGMEHYVRLLYREEGSWEDIQGLEGGQQQTHPRWNKAENHNLIINLSFGFDKSIIPSLNITSIRHAIFHQIKVPKRRLKNRHSLNRRREHVKVRIQTKDNKLLREHSERKYHDIWLRLNWTTRIVWFV